MTARGSRNSPGLLPLEEDAILKNTGLRLAHTLGEFFTALVMVGVSGEISGNFGSGTTHSERTTDTCDAGLSFPGAQAVTSTNLPNVTLIVLKKIQSI